MNLLCQKVRIQNIEHGTQITESDNVFLNEISYFDIILLSIECTIDVFVDILFLIENTIGLLLPIEEGATIGLLFLREDTLRILVEKIV